MHFYFLFGLLSSVDKTEYMIRVYHPQHCQILLYLKSFLIDLMDTHSIFYVD